MYLASQANAPSLPSSALWSSVYDALIGVPTGFNYLTRTGAVAYAGSAVHVRVKYASTHGTITWVAGKDRTAHASLIQEVMYLGADTLFHSFLVCR